ncbi:general substrate transporter [Meredithblackwellia eburnea MCA 4105]
MAPYYGLRGKSLNRAVAFIAGMGFLLFGYDQGVMGGLLTLESFIQTFPSLDTVHTTGTVKSHNSTILGVSIAIYEIGCMIGALSCLYVGEKFGRRKTILLGSTIMIIGAALQCSAFSLGQLVAGRVVTGLGNGFITATVPTWQSECAKAKDRGYLVMIEGALITGGICVSYWIDFAFYWLGTNSASWRAPIAFQILFALVIIAFILPLPESPRWLIKKGRIEEAADVFAALDDLEPSNPIVQAQIEEIRATLPLVEGAGLRDIFGKQDKEQNFWRVSLGFWNQVMQQITGINLITYYAATIYETSIGLSPLNSKILAAANGTEYFLASFIAVYTIESFGRRKLMLFGAFGQAVTMALLTITTWLATKPDALPHGGKDNSKAGIVAAILLFVFNSFFAIGWLGMTWLYPAEINSLRVRTPANGISTAGNWIFNFMVVLITPVAFDSIGYYTYTVFAAINLMMCPVVYFFYPETAGRSLEEIDDIFAAADPKKPWSVVKVAAELPFRPKAEEAIHGGAVDPEAAYALRQRFGGKRENDEHVENSNQTSQEKH